MTKCGEHARASSLRFVRRIWRTNPTWRPSPVGASVRLRVRGTTMIGFGLDGQDALEEAVRALGGWTGGEMSYRGRSVGMRRRSLKVAVDWVRAIDRDRLLRNRGLVQGLEALARLLVRDALRPDAGEELL